MSWAAHNPEAYDEICVKAVYTKLTEELTEAGFYGFDSPTVAMIAQVLKDETSGPTIHNAWHYLTTWANKEVSDGEADYLSSRVPE